MDHISRESATLKKSCALRPLFARRRRFAVLAGQDCPRALELAFGGNAIDGLPIDALGLQIMADSRRTEFARQRADPLFGVAFVTPRIFWTTGV